MNYIDIYKTDTTNGKGIRVVLWVAGCSHHCFNCHNPQTWNKNAGQLYTQETEKELFEAVGKFFISGITLSGGDPLFSDNLNTILDLVQKLKNKFPDKTIWLYTGFTFEDIFNSDDNDMKLRQQILRYVDVLVDGPFIQDLKDLNLKWKGSSNQRVIDLPETFTENRIILYEN